MTFLFTLALPSLWYNNYLPLCQYSHFKMYFKYNIKGKYTTVQQSTWLNWCKIAYDMYSFTDNLSVQYDNRYPLV